MKSLHRREPLKQYLITDPKYYTNDVVTFENKLREVLSQKNIDIACFRDKTSNNYKELATLFITICKEYNVEQILLNENLDLAKELNCGIHLTSQQFDKIKEAKQHDMYVVISCHSIREIERAQEAFVNAVTYSPIFETPNKGEPKGMAKFRKAVRIYEDLDIIALGGIISKKEVDLISKTRAYGFTSIRYFLS